MKRSSVLAMGVLILGAGLLASAAAPAAGNGEGVVRDHPTGAFPSATPAAPSPGAASGWPRIVDDMIAGPVFHDLDGDGTLDVIVPGGAYLYVFDHTGTIRPGWPVLAGRASLPAAVADLDGDGSPEIAVTGVRSGAHLWVFAKNGRLLPGFPVPLPYQNDLTCSGPVFADLDRDGSLDVGAASELGVSFFHADGTPLTGWPYTWASDEGWLTPQWCAPAVGDLDGNGSLEVVVGNKAYPQAGVHVIQASGQAMPGWPKFTNPIWASPALADLDGDGDLEIIVKTGDWYYYGHRLCVWHHTGADMVGWPRDICTDGWSSRGSPAVADVDGDGALNIVTETADGYLHVFDKSGNYLPGWPQHLFEHSMTSPVLVDVDGDGKLEIFSGYWTANSQCVGAWRLDGSPLPGFPQILLTDTIWKVHAQPHVADIDGDGGLELGITSFDDYDGWVHVIPIVPSTYDVDDVAAWWPKFRRDAAATGVVPLKSVTGVVGTPMARPGAITSVSPNPFNPRTTIVFACDEPGPVELSVHDPAGRRIASLVDGWLDAGRHEVAWSGRGVAGRPVAAGPYLVRLRTGAGIDVRKIVLAK